MFSSKQSVDRHVSNILGRIRDEKERNNRGYQIARLYLEVKEYELAKRYVAGFLSVKEGFAPAHKLLGQILEGLNQIEKAVTAYKRSLEIDEKQKDVVLKICELYLQTDIDPERAKYWAERAEKVWPHHDTVFKLREKIYTEREGDKNTDDLENLIASELVKRPKDPKLRAKLMRLYIDTGRINEAYEHAVGVEKKAAYPSSLEWYQCLQDIFQVYQEETGGEINGAFHQNLLLAQCFLTSLTMEQSKVADVADALHKFDQTIESARKVTGGDDWNIVYREMQAQLYFLAGTLLLKRAQQDHLGWMEATQMAAACYISSYAYEPPHTKTPWYAKAKEEDKKVFDRLRLLANFRASQTGHMMKQMCKGDSQKWISSLKESHFGEKGRGRLYETLFTLRHLKGSKSSSYLYQGSALSSLLCVYPTDAQLKEYDKECHLLYANSLHHLIWIALQYYSVRDRTQPNYNFSVFDDLQYSVTNLQLASPESLCQIDTQIFLWATTRTTALHQQEHQRAAPVNGERPSVLPVLINERLCTVEQDQWWNTAYQLFKNTAKENLGKLRLVLQRGIETVRLCKNHGMDVSLVVHIGRTFEERVEELKAKSLSAYDYSNEIDHLHNRAVQYWREACDILEKFQRNQNLPSPKQKLFASYETPMSDKQIRDLLEEGKFFLACDAMKQGEDELAVEEFDKLNMADASYYQAQILRKMADEAVNNVTRGQEEQADEQEEALLIRARDALYLTMDRTRDNKHHKLAPHLATELDEIESRLNRLNSNKTVNDSQRSDVRGETSAMVDINVSSKSLATPSAQSTPHPKARPKVNISIGDSPQKQFHTQPSPERLDAQIRSLSFSQDTLIKQLMERNEELVKQNAAILAELSASRKLIEKLMTARPIDPTAAYPVVMPAAAASPLHHPCLAPHAAAAQSPLGPHAASTPPRHVQPVPPGAASPFYGSPYRPHPEYEYAAAYSPHAGYPIYPQGAAPAPPLQHYPGYQDPTSQPHAAGPVPKTVPVGTLAGSAGKEPSAAGPVKSSGAHVEEEDYEDYYYEDGSDEGGDDDEGDMYQVPESQLVQDWPYGNNVSISGKSTINYSPQRNQQQFPGQPTTYYGQGPASTGLPMPGPGFFSSPERPTGAYNAGRFIPPGEIDSVSTQLHPPRPGFIGTIGSSVSNAQTLPRAAVADKTGGVVSGRSPAQTGANTTEAALTGGSLIKMPQPPQVSAATKFAIPISSGIFSGSTDMNAAIAVGSPITTVTGVGMTSKDVQPKSPGVNDEDDDEGAAGDDSYQGPDFEPIIPLPEEVEVKTGEEEEKVLFVSRSRLYIFIENQWKERGTGDIKILWKEETGQARVVMRRDQVLKVCANHYILPNMKIDVKSDKEAKILTWIAMDFSEEEGAMQKFSCRFKTEGIAAEFRAKFEEAMELCVKRQKQAVKKEDKDAVKKKDDGVDLLAKLKPKPGSWNCEACYVNNPPEVIACVACTTPKPGAELKTPQQKSIFGAGNVTTGGFNAVTTKASTSGFTFGSPATKPTNTSFTFGQTPSTTQDTKSKATFTFGTPSSSTTQTGFKFGSTTSDNPATSSGFKFGTSTVVTATTNVTETKSTPTISPPKFTFNKPVPSTTTTPAADALKLMASKADSTQSSDKPTFGGFTFTSKPVVSEKKEEVAKKEEKEIEAKEEEAPKANPFASFSFSSTKTVNKPVESKTSEGMAFGTAAASNLDFASLATEDATAFTKKSDFKGFEGAGAKLFEGNKDEAADESGHADDYEPDVDFKPIIPLPDLVEVKTGEEEEEKLFGHRAKLYRHDNETKQWKERGLGEIKILKHKETGRCRVLMRREQVLKLCANHYITAEMSLNPLKTSDRAWCWYASDYSEDEMKYEQLAVKFKSGDVAEKFKDIFEKCQKDIREQPTVTDAENVDENKKDKGAKPQTKSQPSLGEMFKPKTGQWDCQVCYVRNDANLIICVACQTPKPGHEGEAAKQKASEPKKDPFSGGFKIADGAVRDSGQSSGQVFTFGVSAANKKPADETPPKTGFLFGMPTSPKAASFSFTTASTPVSATTAESSGTPFNLSSSGFKFGTSPSTDTTKTPSKETGATKTFGLSTSGFSFTPTTTPAKQDKLKSPQSPEGDYYVNTDEEDSHIYFEPIVQLPEKVDLVTGEEDEEPLYCHRAKLFRYDDNQWKERGLGDIKILRHKQTKKCRLVMRREQVDCLHVHQILKICLNHMISDVLNLQPMQNSQGKAWVWVATDFAEGEPSDEKLAIKFKTAEIANEFKNAFDDAKQGKGKVLDLPPTPIKVRERTDSSSRDSTRERKDSARERKDSAKERERRHSAGKSESPDKVKATTNLESFSFKPQSTSASGTSTSTPKVSFTFGSSDSRVSSVFGGSSSTTAVPGKFTFGSGASISSGFNFGTTPTKLESAASPSGAAGESGKTFGTGTSLLAQMLMSDDPIDVPDLEITYEKKPSKEQAEKAAEFKLPSTFYNYEDAKPCPGCRGCEDDDDYHKDVIFVKEEMPSSEQMALAQKYMLPKSFFLYENKAPCRGCLGCYDDIEGTIYKNKPLATETKGESQKEFKGVEAEPTKNDIGGNAPVFGGNTSGEFSFAAIAAKSPPSAFTFGSKTTSDKPFSFAGSGTQLFRNLKSGEDDDGNDDETVQNEDIHFEPIVHLEEVEVKTGEEEETAIYSQRSKLFRFTDGQWKERGIGDMKILKHNSTGRFRLLMRRDQILKICCNHQITADLELRPMNTSEVAWCWFATDFTDGQPVDEQFALKFKNQDLARQFKEKVTECQHLLNQGGNSNVPVADTDSSNNEKTDDKNVEEADTSAASAQDSDHSYSISEADKSGYEKSEGEGEAEYSGYSQSGAEGGNDDDEYVTDEEEEMQLLFSKRATMLYEDADHSWKQIGMGDLQVVYDDDVNGNRIRMTKDNGALICNHIICKDYQLQCNEKKKFVEWTAKDFSTDEPIKRTFRIQFSSKNAVAEFKAVFAEGLELAKEWDIREVTDFVPTPIFSEK